MKDGTQDLFSFLEVGLVCQLLDVIREADANETSGEIRLALSANIVGEP